MTNTTYRLQYIHPSTDFTGFSMSVVDPAHRNNVATFNNATCGVPSPGLSCYGPGDTFHNGTLPAVQKDPTIVSSSYPLEFTYKDNRDPQAVPSQIDLLYTITLDDTPYRGFFFNSLSIGKPFKIDESINLLRNTFRHINGE